MLQLAGILAVLAVIGKFYAAPALAQVRAALVQDRDQRGRNFYQEVQNCQNAVSVCVISFAAVPAGKRLIIEHVSALARMTAADTIPDIELRGASVYQFLLPKATPGNFAGQFAYTTNEPVLASYDAGQTPQVDGFSTSSAPFLIVASISGYLIDIP